MSQTVKRCAVVAVLAIAALLPQFKTLKTSEAGLALIANAEGCRTSPYQCSAGVWTNGIGHTDGVTPQSQVSERQAAVNLVYDVMRVERGIVKRADDGLHVTHVGENPLPENDARPVQLYVHGELVSEWQT